MDVSHSVVKLILDLENGLIVDANHAGKDYYGWSSWTADNSEHHQRDARKHADREHTDDRDNGYPFSSTYASNMPMIATTRTASEPDVIRCAELLGILFSQEHEFSPNAEVQSRALTMIISNPELGRIFVCEIEGVIQGMVMLLFTVSTFLGQKVALLEDMVVVPAWRGMGLGTKLIDHALDFASREGFGRITLLTDAGNEAAQQFYRSKGFSRSKMVVFRKQLT